MGVTLCIGTCNTLYWDLNQERKKIKMPNHLLLSKVSLLVFSIFIAKQYPCSAKVVPDSSKLTSGDLWLPRELGRFHLKDAGFVEVYERTPSEVSNVGADEETYPEKYNLFITTFNAAAMYIHDPVYQISSPGSHLDDIPSWEGRLKKMGGANTAYWPNYPIRLPKEVSGFDGILQSSGFIPPGKKFGQLEVYNIENGMGPWDIASKSHKPTDSQDWAYHWAIWQDVDGDGLMDCITARFHVGT